MEPNHLDSNGTPRQQNSPSIFSNKDALIRRLEKERDILGRKLKQTIEKSKALHNQLAELDISSKIELTDLRNEVAALKKELAELSEDRGVLLNENEMLLDEISKRENRIARLSRDFEVNDLQFKEFRGELLGAAERLRQWEEKYAELEGRYLSMISGAPPEEGLVAAQEEGEAVEAIEVAEVAEDLEADERAQALSGEVSGLKDSLAKMTRETASLRQYITHLNSTMVGKDRAVSERDAEIARLTEALSTKEKAADGMDEALSRSETLEQELAKAREELEGAFRHRATEVGAIREQYEAEIERLSNHNLTLESELETLKKEPSAAGDIELKAQLEREKAKTKALIEALTQKDRTIEELSGSVRELKERVEGLLGEKEDLEARLRDAEDLKGDNAVLADKVRSLEMSLSGETALRERGEKELGELRRLHDAELARAIEDKAKAEADSAHLSETVSRLAETLSEREAVLTGLEDSLDKQKRALDGITLDKERMSEKASVLSDALESERKIFAEAREAFQESVAKRDEKIDSLSESIERLAGEKESLTASMSFIREEIDSKATWLALEREKLESALREQMNGMEEKMRALVRQIDERVQGYGDILENISEGLTAKTEEPVEPEVFIAARSPKRRPVRPVAALIALVLLLAAGAFIYVNNMKDTKAPLQRPAKVTAPVRSPWAEGIKHTEAGGMDITLTFLNREALGILALSEKVSDDDLKRNHYTLLELKANTRCIPEEFDSSVASNVSFLTTSGAAVPAVAPPALADEGSSVYRPGACGGETGAVSLRRYLSVGRQNAINGMSIGGLGGDAPQVTIR